MLRMKAYGVLEKSYSPGPKRSDPVAQACRDGAASTGTISVGVALYYLP